MFHEMHHAVQYDKINKNEIDYLTYNFLKEDIIMNFDKDFYEKNYKSIFVESDDRKEQIIGNLEFLNSLDSKHINEIIEDSEKALVKEVETYNIDKDLKKNISIGKDNCIDISDYLGKLIKENPEILIENSVLKLEYTKDGNKKSINTLLKEFAEIDIKENTLEHENMYSIYQGVISRKINESKEEYLSSKDKVDIFLSKDTDLVTLEDMESCYKSVENKQLNQLYSRLYKLTCEKTKKDKGRLDLNGRDGR